MSMMFYSHMLDLHHIVDVLDTFFQISGLVVKVDKTKMIAIKALQPRHHPIFTYKGETMQVQSFKYIGINVHRQITVYTII